uniref:RING-type domain-containing protein n=1 Tax=viral metagenome TaxID=1070528 RepID=A0A6C0IU19_9ZZZZ
MSSTNSCFYCAENHHLAECNNNTLFYLARSIYSIHTFYMSCNPPEYDEFYSTLRRRFNLKELKSICIRFLYGRSGLTKQQYINRIEDHIHLLASIHLSNPMNDFIQQYISNNPDNAQDITIVSSSSQVYNYMLVPVNPTNEKKSSFQLQVVCNNNINSETLVSCPICLEDNIDSTNKIQLNCKHDYCFDCISKVIHMNNENPKCSLCRKTITTLCIQDGCKELIDNLNGIMN